MAAEQVRASHILIKHEGSRRKASWKDPDGRVISATTRDAAVRQLLALRDDIDSGKARFQDVAVLYSDCSSAKRGGDLGQFIFPPPGTASCQCYRWWYPPAQVMVLPVPRNPKVFEFLTPFLKPFGVYKYLTLSYLGSYHACRVMVLPALTSIISLNAAGRFGRGQMQKPFEEATYALKVGELSGIVDTDSGVHIILRTS
ncbi:unnamed protein product [Musa textilis]